MLISSPPPLLSLSLIVFPLFSCYRYVPFITHPLSFPSCKLILIDHHAPLGLFILFHFHNPTISISCLSFPMLPVSEANQLPPRVPLIPNSIGTLSRHHTGVVPNNYSGFHRISSPCPRRISYFHSTNHLVLFGLSICNQRTTFF